MASFLQKYSWYHGALGRAKSENILLNQRPGLFLVRDSQTLAGGYVLSVSENRKVCHYIITQRNGQYQIGDQMFNDLAEIVDFYRRHFLDTTTLVEAAPRQKEDTESFASTLPASTTAVVPPQAEKVKAKYNFPGNDPDDLPFKKNDILTIIRKEEEQWWMARDCTGKEGMIPVNYVDVIQTTSTLNRTNTQQAMTMPNTRTSIPMNNASTTQLPQLQRPSSEVSVPCIAEAIQDRHPTVYDPSELKFEKGEKILVLKILDSGIWDGQLKDGRQGTFPFRYVKLLTSDPSQVSQFQSQMHGS